MEASAPLRASEHLPSGPSALEDCIACVAKLMGGLQGAQDVQSALPYLQEAAACLFADAAMLATQLRTSTYSSYRTLLACDPHWLIEYDRGGSARADPWLAYALHNSEPIRGFELSGLDSEQSAMLQTAAQFGFASSLIVPVHAAGGGHRIGVLCLGAADGRPFAGESYPAFKVIARGVAHELHSWWISRMADALIAQAGITAHERRLLGHLLTGLSTKEIARLESQSTAAIDSQIRRLNKKLGVTDRRAAAALAADHGLSS